MATEYRSSSDVVPEGHGTHHHRQHILHQHQPRGPSTARPTSPPYTPPVGTSDGKLDGWHDDFAIYSFHRDSPSRQKCLCPLRSVRLDWVVADVDVFVGLFRVGLVLDGVGLEKASEVGAVVAGAVVVELGLLVVVAARVAPGVVEVAGGAPECVRE